MAIEMQEKMLQLDLRWLKTFLLVADTGSMTEAGDLLARTQAAISTHVKNIEDALGKKVFDRTGKRLVLTATGTELHFHALKILHVYNQSMLSLKQSAIKATVRFGIADVYAEKYLPPILQCLHQHYPDVELSLVCLPSSALIPMIDSKALDLALVTQEDPLRGQWLFSERMFWVSDATADIGRLRPLPLSLYEFGSRALEQMATALDTLEGGYRVLYTSPNIAAQKAAIATGRCLAAIAECHISADMRIADNPQLPLLPVLNVALIGAHGSKQPGLLEGIGGLIGRLFAPTTGRGEGGD
ncbi:MAG TPA: LysR family transcriptional regulator [Serratia grimesii]|uniref:LysR family transcriptional regulator n=1 Tax=Serratia grimesii TaxID=82995 RepID=A0A9C7V6U0_9GAMM|nr:LysR family transcriptional regulator [Serratia grimesii]HCJ99671.1 LysR family transcriptional regulator [Serratia grimesii]